MHTSSQLKKDFVKKWVKGLQICCSSKKHMNLLERKKTIKLSADVAIACARNATTSWSCAVIAEAQRDENNTLLVKNILSSESERLKKGSYQMITCPKRVRSKKILKKSCSIGKRERRMVPKRDLATCIAKRLVKKRTQLLKRLVPGGEAMDEFSLITEALDYIVSLRVQVDVMRRVANAAEFLNRNEIDEVN